MSRCIIIPNLKSNLEQSLAYTPETQKRNKQLASDKAREHKSVELSKTIKKAIVSKDGQKSDS